MFNFAGLFFYLYGWLYGYPCTHNFQDDFPDTDLSWERGVMLLLVYLRKSYREVFSWEHWRFMRILINADVLVCLFMHLYVHVCERPWLLSLFLKKIPPFACEVCSYTVQTTHSFVRIEIANTSAHTGEQWTWTLCSQPLLISLFYPCFVIQLLFPADKEMPTIIWHNTQKSRKIALHTSGSPFKSTVRDVILPFIKGDQL